MEWLQLVEFVESCCWWSKVDRRCREVDEFGRGDYPRLSPHEGNGEAKPSSGIEELAQCVWLLEKAISLRLALGVFA